MFASSQSLNNSSRCNLDNYIVLTLAVARGRNPLLIEPILTIQVYLVKDLFEEVRG